jgi:hypothetical protein
MSFSDQVSKQTNEKLKEMRAAATKQILIDLIQERIKENPLYSFGSLWEEIRKSVKIKNQIMEIPLIELANLLLPKKQVNLTYEDDSNIQRELDRIMDFLKRYPNQYFGLASISQKTSTQYQKASYRLTRLISLGLVIKDSDGYRLNVVPARNFILKCLKAGPISKSKIESINNSNILFIDETLKVLVEIGTIKETDGLYSL